MAVNSTLAGAITGTASRIFVLEELARALPLPWSHYVHLIKRSRSPEALDFYHVEALRGGWSVRQLDRHLEAFLLELGSDFTFVGRQRRLRVGGEWYRVDLIQVHAVGHASARLSQMSMKTLD